MKLARAATTAAPPNASGIVPMGVAAALRESWAELVADARLARAEGIYVKPPAKGLRRSVLCCGWVVLHVFELVVLLGYGAFPKGPAHAAWWLLATLLAGVLYVRVCFSDPGFLSPLTVQRMADDLGLDVTVAGSDATRLYSTDSLVTSLLIVGSLLLTLLRAKVYSLANTRHASAVNTGTTG